MALSEQQLVELENRPKVLPFPGARSFQSYFLYPKDTIIFHENEVWRARDNFQSANAFIVGDWERIAINSVEWGDIAGDTIDKVLTFTEKINANGGIESSHINAGSANVSNVLNASRVNAGNANVSNVLDARQVNAGNANVSNVLDAGRVTENGVRVYSPNNPFDIITDGKTIIGKGITNNPLGVIDGVFVTPDILAAELQNSVNAEAQARNEADAELQGNIDGEEVERKKADAELQGNIDGEEVERKKADAELQGNIDAEARAREDADQNLLRQILTIVPEGLEKLPEYIAGLPEEFEAIRNDVSAKADDAAVVKLTGDQTIGGVKTFSISPIVPGKTSAAKNDGTLIATEAQVCLKADLNSPFFTGIPRVYGKSRPAEDDDELIATEAQVYLKANDAAVVKLTGNQTIGGAKTFSISPIVPSKTTAAANNGTLIATEAQVAAKANSVSGNVNKVQSAASADHATTAGSANYRTAASNTAITSANNDSARLATWADVYSTIMQTLSDMPPMATGVEISGPKNIYWGSTVTYSAMISPAGALGIVDWTLSGSAPATGDAWIEGATSGLFINIKTRPAGTMISFNIIATVRGTNVKFNYTNVGILSPGQSK